MPTIYGESQKAFQRLQNAIICQLNDHSIFAWEHTDDRIFLSQKFGLLASSPDILLGCSGTITISLSRFADDWGYDSFVPDIQRNTTGLILELPMLRVHHGQQKRHIEIMLIACRRRTNQRHHHLSRPLAVVVDRGEDGAPST